MSQDPVTLSMLLGLMWQIITTTEHPFLFAAFAAKTLVVNAIPYWWGFAVPFGPRLAYGSRRDISKRLTNGTDDLQATG